MTNAVKRFEKSSGQQLSGPITGYAAARPECITISESGQKKPETEHGNCFGAGANRVVKGKLQ